MQKLESCSRHSSSLAIGECGLDKMDNAEDVSISEIYAAAAKITGLTITALRRRISDNFNSVFFHD